MNTHVSESPIKMQTITTAPESSLAPILISSTLTPLGAYFL